MIISQDRIERAAKAMFESRTGDARWTWDTMSTDTQEYWRDYARIALTADAPALEAARREGWIAGLREAAAIAGAMAAVEAAISTRANILEKQK